MRFLDLFVCPRDPIGHLGHVFDSDDAREKSFSLILTRPHRYIMATTRNSIKARDLSSESVIVSGRLRLWRG